MHGALGLPSTGGGGEWLIGEKTLVAGKRAAVGRKLADRPNEAVPLTNSAKAPRTARGERTRRKILDAARAEFGSRGFADTGITEITRTAKVALGTFYTYFDSKEEVFRALVQDMSRAGPAGGRAGARRRTRDARSRGTGAGRVSRLRRHPPAGLSDHRRGRIRRPRRLSGALRDTAARIAERLAEGACGRRHPAGGDPLDAEVRAWAIMGMNVFLGLRFGVWGEEDPAEVAAAGNRLIRDGLATNS